MGRQIIMQPDGKFAIFSSVVDRFIAYDCSAEDVLQDFAAAAAASARIAAEQVIEQLRTGGKPYRQFTMTWQEGLELHREHADPQDSAHTKALLAIGEPPCD